MKIGKLNIRFTKDDGSFTVLGAIVNITWALLGVWLLIEFVSWLNGITPWYIKLVVGILFGARLVKYVIEASREEAAKDNSDKDDIYD